ncbi:MAG: hypothetical protein AAGF02_13375 [Actinomycetota bacterium]
MRPTIDRRTFLLGAGATGLLAACGGGGSTSGGGSGGGELFAGRYSAPASIIADGTPQRTLWGLTDELGPLATADIPERIVFAMSRDGELVAPRQDVFVRGDGVPFGYYPFRVPFEEPGVYDIEMSWNGGALQTVVQAFDPAEVELLQPGDAVPAVDTPTFDDARGVDPICTRVEICPFHEVTLAEALVDGLPTVLAVSTPGFCQTAVCGPMLELLIDEHEARGGAFSAVHGEVYEDPQLLAELAATTTAVMDATGMTSANFEPSVFFIDPDGMLVERLDNVVDRSELRESIDNLLA